MHAMKKVKLRKGIESHQEGNNREEDGLPYTKCSPTPEAPTSSRDLNEENCLRNE